MSSWAEMTLSKVAAGGSGEMEVGGVGGLTFMFS